jgi:zinc-ribbon domain
MIYYLDGHSVPEVLGILRSGSIMESSMESPPGASPPTRMCVSCGRTIDFSANVCPYCGHDYRMPIYGPPIRKRSSMPVIAGVLTIIAGLLAIGLGVLYLTMGVSDLENSGVTLPPEVSLEDVQDLLSVCGALAVLFGVIAIIGGVFAIQRKHFALAIIGGLFGMAGIGFFLGALLALIALILVAVSKEEFD